MYKLIIKALILCVHSIQVLYYQVHIFSLQNFNYLNDMHEPWYDELRIVNYSIKQAIKMLFRSSTPK